MRTTSGISANNLKWIAIIAMVIDHIAWKVSLPPILYFIMHFIGRFTMPIMCFFIAEGFHHTRNVKKYALRLLVFALISQIPYNYSRMGRLLRIYIGSGYPPWLCISPEVSDYPFWWVWGPATFNVIFGLLLGLCALWVLKTKLNIPVKIILFSLCILASALCDWMMFGVLWILAFGLNRNSFKHQTLWFSSAAVGCTIIFSVISSIWGNGIILIELGLFIPLIFFAFYNGKKGGASLPKWLSNKWIFYVFYPVHLVIIAFLHYEVGLLK